MLLGKRMDVALTRVANSSSSFKVVSRCYNRGLQRVRRRRRFGLTLIGAPARIAGLMLLHAGDANGCRVHARIDGRTFHLLRTCRKQGHKNRTQRRTANVFVCFDPCTQG